MRKFPKVWVREWDGANNVWYKARVVLVGSGERDDWLIVAEDDAWNVRGRYVYVNVSQIYAKAFDKPTDSVV